MNIDKMSLAEKLPDPYTVDKISNLESLAMNSKTLPIHYVDGMLDYG